MYGLVSREALSKRQSRWANDIETAVKTNHGKISEKDEPNSIAPIAQEKNTLTTTPKPEKNNIITPIKPSIITSMDDPLNQIPNVVRPKNNEDILNQIPKEIRSQNNEDIFSQIKTINAQYTHIILSLSKLQHSIDKLHGLSPVSSTDFIPFCDNEENIGRDNITKLHNNKLDMLVEIIGNTKRLPVIYPFGKNDNIPKFENQTVTMEFNNIFTGTRGVIKGNFIHQSNGVYIIRISNDNDFEKIQLPITVRCVTNLL